jgi:hypothetical protein
MVAIYLGKPPAVHELDMLALPTLVSYRQAQTLKREMSLTRAAALHT